MDRTMTAIELKPSNFWTIALQTPSTSHSQLEEFYQTRTSGLTYYALRNYVGADGTPFETWTVGHRQWLEMFFEFDPNTISSKWTTIVRRDTPQETAA